MMISKLLIGSAVAMAALTPAAWAGSLTTTLTPSVRYSDSTFSAMLPFTTTGGRVSAGQPGIYQVDVSLTPTKAADERGLAGTAFDAVVVNNGSNLSFDPVGGYVPSFNPCPGCVITQNSDIGPPGSPRILISSGPINFIPDGVSTVVGSFFINWNGQGSGDMVLTNQQFFFYRLDNTLAPTQQGAGAMLGFGPVPEPATAVLVSIALIGSCQFRRRKNPRC